MVKINQEYIEKSVDFSVDRIPIDRKFLKNALLYATVTRKCVSNEYVSPDIEKAIDLYYEYMVSRHSSSVYSRYRRILESKRISGILKRHQYLNEVLPNDIKIFSYPIYLEDQIGRVLLEYKVITNEKMIDGFLDNVLRKSDARTITSKSFKDEYRSIMGKFLRHFSRSAKGRMYVANPIYCKTEDYPYFGDSQSCFVGTRTNSENSIVPLYFAMNSEKFKLLIFEELDDSNEPKRYGRAFAYVNGFIWVFNVYGIERDFTLLRILKNSFENLMGKKYKVFYIDYIPKGEELRTDLENLFFFVNAVRSSTTRHLTSILLIEEDKDFSVEQCFKLFFFDKIKLHDSKTALIGFVEPYSTDFYIELTVTTNLATGPCTFAYYSNYYIDRAKFIDDETCNGDEG